jgi:hypothetical protein
MIFRSPPEDTVFPWLARRRDRGLAGQHNPRLGRQKQSTPSNGARWSPRRLVLSTVSVNAVLWAATIFVVWWASSL